MATHFQYVNKYKKNIHIHIAIYIYSYTRVLPLISINDDALRNQRLHEVAEVLDVFCWMMAFSCTHVCTTGQKFWNGFIDSNVWAAFDSFKGFRHARYVWRSQLFRKGAQINLQSWINLTKRLAKELPESFKIAQEAPRASNMAQESRPPKLDSRSSLRSLKNHSKRHKNAPTL